MTEPPPLRHPRQPSFWVRLVLALPCIAVLTLYRWRARVILKGDRRAGRGPP